MKRKQKRILGFTLVELLVVMVILGLLSTLGIRSFISSQKKGRDARRKADLEHITSALELYYNDNDQYPPSNAAGQIVGCDGAACSWNGPWTDQGGGVTYMVQLPADPGGNIYQYSTDLAGTYYLLYARLENTQDRDVPIGPNTGPGVYQGTSCGSDSCNYVVESPNGGPQPTVVND
jgi:general secretion pathway protein G